MSSVGIGKTFTGMFVASVALVVALVVTHEAPRYDAKGTFRTQTLIVGTDGQDALFSTFGGANQNIWIGGGGQTFGGAAFPGTGQNTALGIDAMHAVTTGNGDTAIGFDALLGCTTCYTSTAVGYDALGAVSTAIDNTAVGYLAGRFITTGNENTTIGVESLTACTTCSANTAAGIGAGAFVTTGDNNTAIGNASRCGTTGSNNTCVGASSGAGIQGAIADIAIGPFTLQAATSAQANIAVGSTSLTSTTTGQNNTCVGTFTGTGVTTGSENTALGDHAMAAANVSNDTAIGAFALQNDTGGFNVAVGYLAAATVTSGVANTVIGYNDTLGVTTGNGNTVVGSNIGGLAAGTTNNIILADGSGDIRLQCDSSGQCELDGSVVIGTALDWAVNTTSHVVSSTATLVDLKNDVELASNLANHTVAIGATRYITGTPTANHGTLSGSSTNVTGDITTIGANTSVTLTYSAAYQTTSWCFAQANSTSVTLEGIVVTSHTASAATFSCFAIATGVAANCDDFSYSCSGD